MNSPIKAKAIKIASAAETNINLKKNFEKKDSLPAYPISIYLKNADKWQKQGINPADKMIIIGKNPSICDIFIDEEQIDKEHVLIYSLGVFWFILERGNGRKLKINGIQRRQIILRKNESALIEVAKRKMLISSRMEDKLTKIESQGIQMANKVTVSVFDKEYHFNFSKCAVVGSHRICDIRTKTGPAFAAVIFNYKKKLYIHAVQSNTAFVEYQPVKNITMLSDGMEMKISNHEMKIFMPLSRAYGKGFNIIPDFSKSSFCMYQFNGREKLTAAFEMPPEGKSIYVGRNPNLGMTLDCSNVSRKHSQIIAYENGMMILDCYSTNGTYLNNAKIGKKMAHAGDKVYFGDCKFLLGYCE